MKGVDKWKQKTILSLKAQSADNYSSFSFPFCLSFFQQLYNTADAMVVGRYVSKEALAAVGGTTGTLINLFVGFFVGISSGFSVIISQRFGAQRDEEVSQCVHTAITILNRDIALLEFLDTYQYFRYSFLSSL